MNVSCGCNQNLLSALSKSCILMALMESFCYNDRTHCPFLGGCSTCMSYRQREQSSLRVFLKETGWQWELIYQLFSSHCVRGYPPNVFGSPFLWPVCSPWFPVPDSLLFFLKGATKDMGKMLGGEEEKDPDADRKEEERQEALRQQEEERKAKYAKMESERESLRQGIRDKVNVPRNNYSLFWGVKMFIWSLMII